MNVELIILDSFPSLEKLTLHDDLIIEINRKEYNLRLFILSKKSIILKNISDKITFKLSSLNNKKLLGTSILTTQKLKDLFSIDNQSYILWLEFKNDINNNQINNNNEINSFNYWLYYCIRLKIKITNYINVDGTLLKENIEKRKNFKNSLNKINITNYKNIQIQTSSDHLIGKNDDSGSNIKKKIINVKNILKMKNNKLISDTNYKISKINNFNNLKTKNRESTNNIKNSHKKVLSIKDYCENLEDEYFKTDTNFYQNTSFSRKNIIKSTSNKIINSPVAQKLKQKMDYKGNQIVNRNKSIKNTVPIKKYKKTFSINKMSAAKLKQSHNNINPNIYATKTYNNKILTNSRSLKLLNNTINIPNKKFSKQINNYLIENNNNKCLRTSNKSEPFNKNNYNINSNKEHKTINLNDFGMLDDTNTINVGCVNKNLKDLKNNLGIYGNNKNKTNLNNEDSDFYEYNLLKKDFQLLYTDTFINRIKDELIDLEFNIALEKSLAIFTSYNDEVEFLYFKNLELKKELIKYTKYIKYLNKKIYKLKYLLNCYKIYQKNKFLIKESDFNFNEEIKMQKITQKKIIENIINDKINKRQTLKMLFKNIIKDKSDIVTKIISKKNNVNLKTPITKKRLQKYQTGNLSKNRYTERPNRISVIGMISNKKNSQNFNKNNNTFSVSETGSNINTVSFLSKSRGKFLRTNNGINKIFFKKQ